jgi:enoyl-CoA hydratase/carnithine racemase
MSLIAREIDGEIVRLTLDDPERRNALGRDLLTALGGELDRAGSDPAVRAVVIAARGKVFSAGHDLRELVGGDAPSYTALFDLCTQVMEKIRALPKPVLAEVQGLATAAGCQLAATCDLVVASDAAAFATPGVKIGLFCSTPAVAVARAMPTKKALEMLLLGTPISAQEAERIGLVTRVVPAARLREEAMALARQITTAPADVIAIGKRTFYAQLPLDRPAAYTIAGRAMVENALTEGAQEGMRAFLEKRSPAWTKKT